VLAQLAVTAALVAAAPASVPPAPVAPTPAVPTRIARGPRIDAVALLRGGAARPDTIPVARRPADPDDADEVDDGPSCPRGARLLRLPILSVVGLAAPVAGISALVAHRRMRAASGAMIGGAGYATGVTMWLGVRRDCHAGQALAFAGTPLAAIVGAWAFSR